MISVSLDDKEVVVKVNSDEYRYRITSMAVRNQKEKIFPVISDILSNSKYVNKLFEKLFTNYIKTKNENNLYKHFVELKWAIRDYITTKKLFKDLEKHQLVRRKKTEDQIYFDLDEAKEILYCSFYLKFYLLFYMTKQLKPSNEMHNKIFSNLLLSLDKKGILSKLYKLIQVKVFGSVISDKPFWQYLRFCKGDSPETTCISTYVNILQQALPMLDHNQNPITFLVVYCKNVVDYIFVSAYQDTFFYESMFYYDTSDIYRSKEQDILNLIMVKYLIEDNITPKLTKVFTFSSETSKKLVDINPLTKIVAIPFFSLLTETNANIYKNLNIYYLYTISMYVSYILKQLGYNLLSKALTCAVKEVKKKRNPQFSRKQKEKIKEHMPLFMLELDRSYEYLKQVTTTLRNISFFNIEKGFIEDIKENKLIEELVDFYSNLLSGKFNSIFNKLKTNNFDCFVV